MGKQSENSKSYKTAAKFFAFSGCVLIIVGIVASKIGVYLPIGIALLIVSLTMWRHRGN
jgi:hypothetical protein